MPEGLLKWSVEERTRETAETMSEATPRRLREHKVEAMSRGGRSGR